MYTELTNNKKNWHNISRNNFQCCYFSFNLCRLNCLFIAFSVYVLGRMHKRICLTMKIFVFVFILIFFCYKNSFFFDFSLFFLTFFSLRKCVLRNLELFLWFKHDFVPQFFLLHNIFIEVLFHNNIQTYFF